MTSFKSGSGDLDFGSEEKDETPTDDSQATGGRDEDAESSSTAHSPPDHESEGETSETDFSVEEYPYFVRRNNVGDERATRLEIHVRDKVADQEDRFRAELADILGVNEVSKTDAREFALLAAFQNPEHVAELLKEEGFGALE